jgi:hypothetical protein
MVIQTNVPQRFRRPEKLYTKATYARRTTTVNKCKNRNKLQKVKAVPVKRNAVRKAYNKIRKVSAEFEVRCVKKAFGKGIVRICCRTIQHLDNIAVILEELMKVDFIMEIGMPLEYSYKLKTLVLFIKPKHYSLRNSIAQVFQKCTVDYPLFLVDEEDSSVAAEEKLNEEAKELSEIAEEEIVQTEMENVQTCTSNLPVDMNNSIQEGGKPAQNETNMCITTSPEEERRERELFDCLLLFLKMGSVFLYLYFMFDHEEEICKQQNQ